jgi:hypothetical protein
VLIALALSLTAPLLAALASDPIWLPLLVLLPTASVAVALACALDILRRCRFSDLLTGIVPGQTSLGLLLQLVLAALPALLYVWTAPAGPFQATAVAVFAGLVVVRALASLAGGWLARIG